MPRTEQPQWENYAKMIQKSNHHPGIEQPKIDIYKITNTINRKIYIGQTRRRKRRWREHCANKEKNKSHLTCAIIKYGIENFTFEIVSSVYSQREADLLEQQLIKIHNSITHGYNKTTGGGVAIPFRLSKEVRDRISKTLTGRKRRPLSDEQKEKLSLALKGRSLSTETKLKISKAMIGIKRSHQWLINNTAARIGIKKTIDTKIKMSIAHLGHNVSNETRIKISAARKTYLNKPGIKENLSRKMTGRKLSHAHRKNLRLGWIKRKNKKEDTKIENRTTAI